MLIDYVNYAWLFFCYGCWLLLYVFFIIFSSILYLMIYFLLHCFRIVLNLYRLEQDMLLQIAMTGGRESWDGHFTCSSINLHMIFFSNLNNGGFALKDSNFWLSSVGISLKLGTSLTNRAVVGSVSINFPLNFHNLKYTIL